MMHGCAYNPIDRSYPYKLRGTNQQSDVGLLWQPPAYKAHGAGAGVLSVTRRFPGMGLGYFALHNRSGSSLVMGIGVRIPNELWIAGQWTDATTTFTDDTTHAQNTTTDDFDLETTTNNDGFVIASRVPFNAVSINVSTASVDATDPTRAVRFSDSAGTAWQTADTNLFIHDGSGGEYATGENLIVFAPPVDWGQSSSLATGLGNGYYAMNVRATTAPDTTAGIAKAIEIFRLYFLHEAVSDNTTLLEEFSGRELVMAQDEASGLIYGDALVALFSTANDMNRVTAQVRAI